LALRQEELTSLCDDVDLERDRALVERCQAGDSAAFGNLYARYYDRLFRFCFRRLNDRHEAEDAAQEAFARAWKALPRFAGERRFYPWLTVIAGNICTDMLRRRSRSTPTDDMELTAQQPVGGVGEDTSEDLVLAAVDGELVNRALDRLSARHRHVLAMREGSGWTYQQIADHEGVEIGTIETLLWRARQALKREFAVVSESKEALAGFLIATGALLKRAFLRVAHRGARVHHQGGSSGEGLRNAVAGVAVTGAAVAAAFIAPHALSTSSSPLPGAPSAALAAPQSIFSEPHGGGGAGGVATGAGGVGGGGFGGVGIGAAGGSGEGTGSSGGTGGLGSNLGGAGGIGSGGLNQTAGGIGNTVGGVTNGLGGAVGGVANDIGGAVGGAAGNLGGTIGNVTSGVSGAVGAVGGAAGGIGGTVGGGASSGLSGAVSGATQSVNGLMQGLGLGSGSGSSATGTGSSTPATTTTTTTGLLGGALGDLGSPAGGAGDAVSGLLGG
jgi:RNA polymerase sigma factor (sigma-70 family)